MRRLTDWTACLASILLFSKNGLGAPELAFPINSQVPPVAYAAKPYSFIFADTTFRSDAQSITYAISDAPQWLSIDSSTRTLRGTPAQGDVGAITFALSASDGTGSTATSVTLVIFASQSVSVGEPILPSLRIVGQVQAPSTLFLSPLSPFTIPISQQIFSGTTVSTTYYAVSDDNSPLPPWIQFDLRSLSLTGTTPPILSSVTQQQTYGVKVVATNVPGFSESSITFTIAVANRLLYFQSATETINVTRGQNFESEIYRDILLLNGQPISESELGPVQANLPSWLSLDPKTITLSGTPPEGFTTQLITITAQDLSNDIANLTVTLRSASTPRRGETLNITARQGEYLVATISPTIVQTGDQVTVDLEDAATWLSFSQTNMSFYGQVPKDLNPTILNLSLAVTESGSTTTYPVSMSVMAAEQTPTSSSSSSSTTDGIVVATGTASQDSEGKPRHVLAIVLTSVLVFLAVVLIILFLLWYKKRKEKKQREKELSDDEQAGSHYSSAPSEDREESINEDVVDVRPPTATSRHTSHREMVETPSKVPQVELPWAPDSLKKARSRLQKKRPSNPHDSFDSNWGGLVPTRSAPNRSPVLTEDTESGEIVYPAAPPPIPSYSPKRKQSLASTRIAKRSNSKRSNDQRLSRALSNVTNRRSGLPNRLSNAGVGHGSGILAPSQNAANPYRNSKPPTRSSWATTYASTLGGKENMRPSIVETNLESFPLPPATDQGYSPGDRTSGSLAGLTDTKPSLAGLASTPTKPSLRLVSASPTNASHAYDPEEFSFRRQEYIKSRRQLEGQSMLFSNSSSRSRSRTPSLSRFVPGTQAIRSPSNTFPIAEESSPDSPAGPPPAGTINWSKLNATSPSLMTAKFIQRPTNSHILSPMPQRPPTRFGLNHTSNVPSQYGNDNVAAAGTRASRAISVSSGQFSSALSSDDASQWEDYEPPDIHSPYQGAGGIRAISGAESATDDLLHELINNDGERQWTTTSSSNGNSAAASPRLPFDGGRPSGETEEREVGLAITRAIRRASQLGSGESRGLRLVDKRKRIISVDGKERGGGGNSSERPHRGRDSGAGSGVGGSGDNHGKYAWGGREKSQRGSLRFI